MSIIHHMTGQLCLPLLTCSLLTWIHHQLHGPFRQLNLITTYPFKIPGTCHVHHPSDDLYAMPILFVRSICSHSLFRQLDHMLLRLASSNLQVRFRFSHLLSSRLIAFYDSVNMRRG